MRMTTPCTALSVGAVGWSMNSDANKRWETHNGVSRVQTMTQLESECSILLLKLSITFSVRSTQYAVRSLYRSELKL